MNRYGTAVLMFTVAVTAWVSSVAAQAQDAKAQGPGPVEAFYCNLKEGKNVSDLMKVAEGFSKWADKHDPTASAWVLTPQFGMGAEQPQVIWLGSNPTGNDFGKGLDAWRATGGELAKAFAGVVDCSAGHVLASSIEISAPDGPPGDGIVMFSQCKIDAASDWTKAIAAHKTFSGAMRSLGGKGSNWLFFPMLGGGDPAYDYLAVTTFKNYTDFGASYELYVTGGGWQKAMETYKGVTSCNLRPPTVWDVKLVRQRKS